MTDLKKKYIKKAIQTIICLDSGASVNIISWKNLMQYFPTINKAALTQENLLLSSANNTPIEYLGCIKLNIRIGNRANYEKFYITADKCNNILGLPGIKDFDMVINIKKEICQVSPNKGQVNVITESKVPNFIRLTPAKKYLITVQTPQLIELSLCLASRGLDLLNKKIVIFIVNVCMLTRNFARLLL